MSGRDFEMMFTGQRKPTEKPVFVVRKPIEESLQDSISNAPHISTDVALKLKSFVEKYLKSLKGDWQLSFQNSLGTRIDAQFGGDVVFVLKLAHGSSAFVTIDLFSISERAALNTIVSHYPERFEVGGDISDDRWTVRLILMGKDKYSQFQDYLFNLKMRLKGKIPRERWPNHFILTPFDINRGRGLRSLGREIAKSLKEQIQPKPV